MNAKRTVLVVAHVERPAALRNARLVVDRLTAAGVTVRILETEAADLRCAGADVVPAAPGAAQDAEMVIVLGGDGTLLRAAEMARPAGAPLLAALPDGALMARAATGLARVCAGLLDGVYGSHVLLLVGSGNNGGDALYAGAALARRGANVSRNGKPMAMPPAPRRKCRRRIVVGAGDAAGDAAMAVPGIAGVFVAAFDATRVLPVRDRETVWCGPGRPSDR